MAVGHGASVYTPRAQLLHLLQGSNNHVSVSHGWDTVLAWSWLEWCIPLCKLFIITRNISPGQYLRLKKILLFLIAVRIISKGPVSQHFYWLFGGKLKTKLKKKIGKIMKNIRLRKEAGWLPQVWKKNDEKQFFLLGLTRGFTQVSEHLTCGKWCCKNVKGMTILWECGKIFYFMCHVYRLPKLCNSLTL